MDTSFEAAEVEAVLETAIAETTKAVVASKVEETPAPVAATALTKVWTPRAPSYTRPIKLLVRSRTLTANPQRALISTPITDRALEEFTAAVQRCGGTPAKFCPTLEVVVAAEFFHGLGHVFIHGKGMYTAGNLPFAPSSITKAQREAYSKVSASPSTRALIELYGGVSAGSFNTQIELTVVKCREELSQMFKVGRGLFSEGSLEWAPSRFLADQRA